MKTPFFVALLASAALFGEMIVIDNQTTYPSAENASQIAIQWASSSKDLESKTVDTMYQVEKQTHTMMIQKTGSMQIAVPGSEKYFRVLVWTKEGKAPKYVTNWVLIVPNKTYSLKQQDLYEAVLSSGSGC